VPDTLRGLMHLDSGIRTSRAVSRLAGVVLSVIVLMSAAGGVALGVVGGKTVSITAAPWTVVVWEPTYLGQPRYPACAGVIIDPRHVLTAGHCVMEGNSAKPLRSSAFRIEAGVSNYKHPLASDDPQFRAVSDVRVMPGYIATSSLTSGNQTRETSHDLGVLTLSQPLDLHRDDARAALLPTALLPTPTRQPSSHTRLLIAGYGAEKPKDDVADANGTLNEVVKPTVRKRCSSSQVLCVFSKTDTCWGDSGAGAVEPGPSPTVVGIESSVLDPCRPGVAYYVSLTAPAVLRFINTNT
jgi:Trypsin